MHCLLINPYKKGKVHPCTGTEGQYRPYGLKGMRGIVLSFHDHGTRRGELSVSRPGRSFPGKDVVTTVQEAGWASGTFSTGAEKFRPPPGFEPRTVQPVASRYTEYTTRPTLNPYVWK
jgi:hypothetical protein